MSSQNSEMVNRLAFVGNLPPDATAEEMKQLCSQVGEVILFRIVYDRETGKPKGYGFCEYRDSKLVDAAVDLLHGFEHRGSSLYVRRANQEKQSSSTHIDGIRMNKSTMSGSSSSSKKKKKQQSVSTSQSSSKRKSVDEIQRVVSSFSTSEKREILSQMKVLIEQNEKGAKEILLENPQLSQALLLIQIEFNLVKVQDIHALTQNVNNHCDINNIIINENNKKNKEEKEKEKEEKHDNNNNNNNNNNNDNNDNDNDIDMINNEENGVNEGRLKGLSNQQQIVLGRVMKMSASEIAKLPDHVQKQVLAVQAQLK